MKNYLRLAENYALLLASLTLGLFLLLFAPKDGGVSETENRRLQAFPEPNASALASGESTVFPSPYGSRSARHSR